MDNYLENGAVLPSGLLGNNGEVLLMAGFNKSYRNTPLRMGIIVKSYPISDPGNLTKLTTEYDILVFEQYEDKGSSIMTYPHCISSEGLGSIADYFEKTLRVREGNPSSSSLIDTKNQNGAVVLILCLDGMSDKAIIIGAVTHPDRKTNLANNLPFLQGEYNGCNLKIANDGSIAFTFKGATDNNGKVKDTSQGNTVITVKTDGSFEVSHSKITFTLAKDGNATLTAGKDLAMNVTGNVTIAAQGNVNVQCKDATVTASGTATVEGSKVNLGQGASDAVIKGDAFKSYFDGHTHPTAVGPSGPPVAPMPGSTLSKKVKTE